MSCMSCPPILCPPGQKVFTDPVKCCDRQCIPEETESDAATDVSTFGLEAGYYHRMHSW